MTVLIATLALLAAQSSQEPSETQQYSAIEIKPPGEMKIIGSLVLTEGGIVAGTRYTTGDGRYYSDPLPFVFVDGEWIDLHPGSSSEGEVYGGNDSVLVGSLILDSEWVPVQWAPTKDGDWNTAIIRFLSLEPGLALHVAEDAIWVSRGERLFKIVDGELVDTGLDKFDYAGIDVRGWMYGTRYSSIGAGSLQNALNDTRAAIWKKGSWVSLHPDDAELSGVDAVSSKGIAVGYTYTRKGGSRACVWEDEKLRYLERNGEGAHIARDVNNSGIIVGRFNNGEEIVACLWNKDGLQDISRAVSGLTLKTARAINDRGQILVETSSNQPRGSTGYQLFLLTPKD